MIGHLDIDPTGVAAAGSQVAASGHSAFTAAPVLTPPAADPVSVGIAQTLTARAAAIAGHSSAAAAITQQRAGMLADSAMSYVDQEAANRSALGGGGGIAGPPAPPVPSAPALSVAPTTTPPPVLGPPPPSGKAIAALIHGGPGPAGLRSAAQQLRTHAAELDGSATTLRGSAAGLDLDWDSDAGHAATARIRELGAWYDKHAGHAIAAATAIENQADNYSRARAGIPTPQRFAEVEQRLRTAQAANNTPGMFGRYTAVVAQLQSELAQLNRQAVSGYADYTAGADGVTGEPLEPPPSPGGGIQAAGFDVPLTPPEDPPHGKDPRYWLDSSKLIQVPDGQKVPYGYIQVGPELWHPDPHAGFSATPPPPPAKFPFDVSDIRTTAPNERGPYGYQIVAENPDLWYWAPDPSTGSIHPSPWPAPEQPIDLRDIIEVPEGQLAPWGYIEYLPGWFVPGPPQPR